MDKEQIATRIRRERQLWKAKDEAELDLRVSQRELDRGDIDAETHAKREEAMRVAAAAWYAAHVDAKAAFGELLADLGLTSADIAGIGR